MSELNATIKVDFRKLNYANIFHLCLSELKELSNDSRYEFAIDSGFYGVNLSNYDLAHIEISSIKQDKKNVQFHLWGGVGSASEVLQQLYKGIDGRVVKTFVSSAYDDQAGYNYYPCYHDNIYYDYGEEQNPGIDKKLLKAEENGNKFDVLEKLLKSKKLLNEEMALNDCISEYVKSGEFRTRFLNVKNIETGRNSDGDTLLTAMIKAGNEKESIWLLDVPMVIDHCISDADGTTPYELAKKYGLKKLTSYMEEMYIYRANVDLNSPKSYTVSEDFPLIDIANRCMGHGLYMYEFGYVSISYNEVMLPGENQIFIFNDWDRDNNKKCYRVSYYNQKKPQDHYSEKVFTLDQILKCIDDYASQ
ncbi:MULTISPECIES: hypothetical protein [Thalassolituus]|jgi:hypothetical protein|uniref:hypothetical protein n=1 Tax=Thalassolituus TaxID=187492 RepID=UPI001E302E6E|nr:MULTISPECIES: hypothetical protein [Thalassolituus]MCB2384907.1 hypothetical protein [Thalassolituus alkanivorans]MCB2421784.1 hypothetical protein [Thalassolituus alkanivorans]|tara:strand:+ start:518 stop:1603 length:1086 start_codon:yes stop_codon:yes gene_type:complete